MSMKSTRWKNIKFWCWLELDFPAVSAGELRSNEDEFWIPADDIAVVNFGASDQGPQCGPKPHTMTRCFDLLSFSSDFELNAIPTAIVSVALGRRANDVTQAANIHNYIDDLKIQLPARVYLQAKTNAASDWANEATSWWPDEEFKVFDGYVTGSAFRRSTQGAELTLSVTHWLTDLNFSSALSRTSHPLNPSHYFMDSNYSPKAEGAGTLPGQNQPVMTGAGLAQPYFITPTILTDMWGGQPGTDDGMKNWFFFLTQQDRINVAQINDLSVGTIQLDPQKNWEACRALKRIEPHALTPDLDETGYVLGVPLSLPDYGDLNGYISASIADDIGQESLETYSNVTLWDKLAGQFHSNYMFSIVPLVDKALVVPFVPGLMNLSGVDNVHRIIYASQYEVMDMQATIPRPLRAVGVIMGRNNEAGGGESKNESAPYGSFGGYFDKMANSTDQRFKEGLVMIKQGPRWLTNFVRPSPFAGKSTGSNGDKVSTVADPGEGEEPDGLSPREILRQARPVWDLYARTLYIHEVLKNRQATISCPVRFDIAPGSQLMIEATEDNFVKEVLYPGSVTDPCNLGFQTFYWAAVLRVSTTIDCQNMKARTSFHLAHIRDSTEIADPAMSIPYHPIWQQCRWAGCSLVQHEAFAPLVTKECDEDE